MYFVNLEEFYLKLKPESILVNSVFSVVLIGLGCLMFIMKHNYLKDAHWYFAIVIAIVFWVAIDFFVYPASPQNVFSRPEILFFSILLYPMLEEIVFRGLIQSQLMLRVRWRKQWRGISAANVITSVLFSLLHLMHQDPLMVVLIFFPSLIFGYFKDRHQSVLPSIWLHVFYNAGFFYLFF